MLQNISLLPKDATACLGQGWHCNGHERVCDSQRSHRVYHCLDWGYGYKGRRNIEPLHAPGEDQDPKYLQDALCMVSRLPRQYYMRCHTAQGMH